MSYSCSFSVFAVIKLHSRFTSNCSSSTNGLNKPLIKNNNRPFVSVTIWFKLTLAVTSVLALLYTIACVMVFTSSTEIPWKQVDGMIWLDQAITQLILAVLIIYEKRFQAVTHPLTLRVYWIVHFIITCLFVASGIIRLVSVDVNGTKEFIFKVDYIVKSTFGLF
ncbi:hypothetical protein HN51_011604 [Arachis hypogaea]